MLDIAESSATVNDSKISTIHRLGVESAQSSKSSTRNDGRFVRIKIELSGNSLPFHRTMRLGVALRGQRENWASPQRPGAGSTCSGDRGQPDCFWHRSV